MQIDPIMSQDYAIYFISKAGHLNTTKAGLHHSILHFIEKKNFPESNYFNLITGYFSIVNFYTENKS